MSKNVYKKLTIVLAVLLVLNIIATVLIGIKLIGLKEASIGKSDQYVIYVGLKDMTTQNQEVTVEEAMDKIDDICFKYVDGYTLEEGYGCRISDDKLATRSKTIICRFDGASKSDIYAIADEIIAEFNQDTVFIESDSISMEYYAGK